ncbi:putative penicillin-binding protein [Thelonectria olida]|uniref:Penicillin-binding protein n=1 Tax=Thelonectria olida TaxID=1576542 RepID=A0A9P9ANK9_9HYPO|nr:putative penicillin-binding protein [Thelonectria olida]
MASFLLGSILPSPSGLVDSPSVKAMSTSLSSSLLETLQHDYGSFGESAANKSSVSITAVSTEDEQHSPFFNFHFSSPTLNDTMGTKTVTEASIYRIGSISKLFTVYVLLLNLGREYWDHSVTRYVPELRHAASSQGNTEGHAVDHVDWDQVSVSSLASQLSGIGRDYANGDVASQGLLWKAVGLPELPSEDIPKCAGNSSLPPCNRQEYFEGFTKRHPVFAPETTPVYSNAAYRILGYVLQAASGMSFSEGLKSSVLTPLGLTETSAKRPQSRGSWVIPQGDSGWYQDVGDEAPTAGMFSSSRDLAKFGRAILAHKLLPAIETRRWMKPHSHTASLIFSVGSPWEIWRTKSGITSGRTIDLYTKSGSIGAYNSHLILIPDYGVSVAVLAAGSSSSLAINAATEVALQAIIPTLEKVSRDQACKALCGTYRAAHNSSLTISADRHGLVVSRWISRGLDYRAVAQEYAESTGGGRLSAIRLQKTNLESPSGAKHKENGVQRVAYRAIFDTNGGASDFAQPLSKKSRIFDPTAHQWSSVDNPMYGEIASDDFLLHLDQSGSAVAVEPRISRELLYRN